MPVSNFLGEVISGGDISGRLSDRFLLALVLVHDVAIACLARHARSLQQNKYNIEVES